MAAREWEITIRLWVRDDPPLGEQAQNPREIAEEIRRILQKIRFEIEGLSIVDYDVREIKEYAPEGD